MSTVSSNGNAPKSMSARLLTMKFMQRAASSSTASTASMTVEPSSKRRKKESDSTYSGHNVDFLSDRNAVLDALAKEEEKSLVALDKLASESGDTRWVLNLKEQDHPMSTMSLRIVHAGYANLDDSISQNTPADEICERSAMFGRRSFGKFNRALEKQQNPHHKNSSESDSGEDNDTDMDSFESDNSDEDDNDPASQLIKSTRREVALKAKADLRAKKREAKEGSNLQIAKSKRQGEVSLNHLTSLSGRQEVTPKTKIECYSCGGPHRKIDCPKRKRGKQYNDDGPPKKLFRPT